MLSILYLNSLAFPLTRVSLLLFFFPPRNFTFHQFHMSFPCCLSTWLDSTHGLCVWPMRIGEVLLYASSFSIYLFFQIFHHLRTITGFLLPFFMLPIFYFFLFIMHVIGLFPSFIN